MSTEERAEYDGVAVVGMAGCFPGARDLREFWNNLSHGKESIRFFSQEELLDAGVDPTLLAAPGYVPASGHLADADLFDPFFFGFSARDAEIMDPQQRLFLEQAWLALESAGLDPATYHGVVGVFGGMSASSYLLRNLLHNRKVLAETPAVELRIRTDKDFLTSQVAYKLGLVGPSITVQAACSTSLVATVLACQSLTTFQCDVALAGGVSVASPLVGGSSGQGEYFTADGHCRAFDANATGTPNGYGAGVVTLKRLDDALAEGDNVRAVIRGFAVNNDGNLKAGYTAPSVAGQSEVISMALAMADLDPESIGYVEAHGTGTPLGDPIEVAALTDAFSASTAKTGFCALGSVKTNIGHLDAAAGVASLIKTVLAVEHGQIPPSLNFERPNPNIDFEKSPFFVNTELTPWPRDGGVRRAGVSSFAVGGVNAHLVLEEAPQTEPSAPETSPELLILSAKTATALESMTDRMVAFLEKNPRASFSDVCSTLRTGRTAFKHRRMLVCEDRLDAIAGLTARNPERVLSTTGGDAGRPVFFLLPGLGDQYPEVAGGLYRELPIFRREVDRCSELLAPHLGFDLRDRLYPRGAGASRDPATREATSQSIDLRRLMARKSQRPVGRSVDETLFVQPALFVIEYALARVWMELGVEPSGFVGFSLGEYVAAHLAGVFTLEQSLRLVAERARAISELPRGAMLAVTLSENRVRPMLTPGLALSAVCSDEAVIVAGAETAVADFAADLSDRGVTAIPLNTTHAFHSPMLEGARTTIAKAVKEIGPRAPQVPFLSNVTGRWITPERATDPEYWADHLVSTVRFADNLAEVWKEPGGVLLEVGPGRSLGAWALQHPARRDDGLVASSLRHEHDPRSDLAVLFEAVGRLWLGGLDIRWQALHEGAGRRRVELPSYPFERQRFWIEPDVTRSTARPEPDAGKPARPGPPPDPEPATETPAQSLHRRPNLDSPYAEPTSDLERRIADHWQEVLGIEPIGIHDDFFALGGESIRAPRLLLKLEDLTGVKLTLRSLFQAPTVARMAKMIEQERGETEPEAPSSPTSDLEAEAVLDPSVVAGAGPRGRIEEPQAVLVTGSTGFLGAYLLARILRETSAQAFCLVRADDEASGRERIRKNLERYRIWRRSFADRIRPVIGDLASPWLGIAEPIVDDLAERLDAIYHCGAWVNATYDYDALKQVNVLGTQEALRLAGKLRPKPFHFVSTIAVFNRHSCTADGVAFEDAVLSTVDEFESGYVRTKWVAERLIGHANERGIPTTIYRAPLIGGPTDTGLGNHRDLVWNLLKGCIQLQATFDMDDPVDIAPVDYVSDAIVHLSRRPESLGEAYHLTNPRRTTWGRLCDAVREAGYPLEPLPYEQWYERLVETARRRPELALAPFLPVIPPPDEVASARASSRGFLRHDAARIRRNLEGSGIECPPITTELIHKYMKAFVAQGFLAEPAEPIATGTESAEL